MTEDGRETEGLPEVLRAAFSEEGAIAAHQYGGLRQPLGLSPEKEENISCNSARLRLFLRF